MTRRIRSFAALLGAVVGFLGLGLGLAGTALAQTGYPPSQGTAAVSDTNPSPGEAIQVSGSGFQPSSQVAVVLGTTFLRSAGADAQGAFSTTVTIPCETPAGPTTLQAQGTGADNRPRVLSSNLTIDDDPAAVCPAGAGIPGGTGLPRTGDSSSAPLTAAGVGLVVIGLATVITARRRRTADAAL